MNLKTLKDAKVENQTVLVRTDYNVVIENNEVIEDERIKNSLPTIEYLLKKSAKIVIISHLGRPQKDKGQWTKKYSLEPVALRLAELLGRKFLAIGQNEKNLPDYKVPHVYFFPQNILKNDLSKLISQMSAGDVSILENIRFYSEEEDGDENFADTLASLGTLYVNESFSADHRGHASVYELAKKLDSYAGFSLLKEVHELEKIINHPKRPVVAMLGGVKLETKAPTLERLARDGAIILTGGGLANIFLKAKGYEIGKSVGSESGQMKIATQLVRDFGSQIILPIDLVVSTDLDGQAEVVLPNKIRPYQYILDVGPATIKKYSDYLRQGMTLIWNGPMGYFEQKQFSHGTMALGRFFASRTKTEVFGLAGGGETLQVINKLNIANYIDHISMGGGAMLEYLAGNELPGIEVLKIQDTVL